jgi:hypothetical protein
MTVSEKAVVKIIFIPDNSKAPSEKQKHFFPVSIPAQFSRTNP